MHCRLRSLFTVLLIAGSFVPAFAAFDGSSTLYAPSAPTKKPGSLYPRALRLQHSGAANGSMLATFEEYGTGRPSFPIYRSTDGGGSWALYSRVADTQNGWGMRFQPFLYELPQAVGSMPAGTILCLGDSIPDDLSATRLEMYKSVDHGATWSFVSHIAQGGAANPDGKQDPVWEPFALLANGKLIVFYSDERDPAYNQKIVHQTTTDGLKWSSVVDDVALAPKRRPGMPVVARMGNGRYVMSWECVCEGTIFTAVKTTADPEHWNAADVGTSIPGSGGTPYTVWMPSGGPRGTLVLSSNENDHLYINRSYAEPGSAWVQIPAAVGFGYSRSFVVLPGRGELLEISPIEQKTGEAAGYNHIVAATQMIE